MPNATLFFTAVFLILSIPMAIAVGVRRAKTGIMLLHGDDAVLLRRMRAHQNFVEYVPLALLGLGAAELAGTPGWLVIAAGAVLIAARLLHYASLVRRPDGNGRFLGAGLTSLTILILAVATLLALAGLI